MKPHGVPDQHVARPDRRRGGARRGAASQAGLPAPGSTCSTWSRCRCDSPFRSLPNVLATPHLGYVTQANYQGYYREALEDIHAYLAGAPIRVIDR